MTTDVRVSFGDSLRSASDCLLIGVFDGEEDMNELLQACNRSLNNGLEVIIKAGELSGNTSNFTLLHTFGGVTPDRLLFCGLGDKELISRSLLRDIFSSALRRARGACSGSVSIAANSFVGPQITENDVVECAAESSQTGLYRYERFKSVPSTKNIKLLDLVVSGSATEKTMNDAMSRGISVGNSVNIARDLANAPPNFMTPTELSNAASGVARETGVHIEIIEREEMAKLGMGALIGVSQGSTEPPKFIVLRYEGDQNNPDNSIALLGKGITFDSGGLDLKSASGMRTMKGDMAGGAAVIGAMKAISDIRPTLNVVGIVPATENMPGGGAQRPGDVVSTMDGTTLEIDNTDAEGRLVLADAVCYARSLGITKIVDVATLTGAVRAALGQQCIGAFGNDSSFTEKVIAAGSEVGERIWELPTYDEYANQYDSDIADIKNTGGAAAGAIIGAMIIGRFAGDASWVHLDIAATSLTNVTKGDRVKGATGSGVRTLISLCELLSS